HPGNVPTRPREALDQADRHRVLAERKDNGDRRGGRLRRDGRLRPSGHDHVDLEPDELGCQGGYPVQLTICGACLEAVILTFPVAEVPQPEPERLEGSRQPFGRRRRQVPDPGDAADWLRDRAVRGGEKAETRQEEGRGPLTHRSSAARAPQPSRRLRYWGTR